MTHLFLPTVNFGLFFRRPFVKRFALCYHTVVCLSCLCLSLTLVYCGQTVGCISMKLGMQVGLSLGHTVLDGDPARPTPKRAQPPPQFLAHICCGHGGATVRHLGLRSIGRGFKSCSRQRCVTTSGKLFTPMCLCHQAV